MNMSACRDRVDVVDDKVAMVGFWYGKKMVYFYNYSLK